MLLFGKSILAMYPAGYDVGGSMYYIRPSKPPRPVPPYGVARPLYGVPAP